MSISRREALKSLAIIPTSLFLDKEWILPRGTEQNILINLPAYELTLTSYKEGILKQQKTFPISIGKGDRGRRATPIGEGFITDKRYRVLFRYGKAYPQYNKKAGDIIWWTNTFDKKGNQTGYRMPYDQMRGLGMLIRTSPEKSYDDRYVIHSTTDEFTIGTPSSSGCIRVGMQDMFNLYDLVQPEVKKWELKRKVPVKTVYDCLEIQNNKLIIHADVYHKGMNYLELLKDKIKEHSLLEEYNPEHMKKEFTDADNEFNSVLKEILDILDKGWPNNYLSSELKARLHRTYDLSDFV